MPVAPLQEKMLEPYGFLAEEVRGSNPLLAELKRFPDLDKDEVPQSGCYYRARLSLKWPESWLGASSRVASYGKR